MAVKCPLLVARCVYVLTLLHLDKNTKIDPHDYRWTLTAKRSSRALFVVKKADRRRRTHLDAILNGEETKRAKSIYLQMSASWFIVEHIKNRFGMVNWTQIYLILKKSQNILAQLAFLCVEFSSLSSARCSLDLNSHSSSSIIILCSPTRCEKITQIIRNHREFWGRWCCDKLTADRGCKRCKHLSSTRDYLYWQKRLRFWVVKGERKCD